MQLHCSPESTPENLAPAGASPVDPQPAAEADHSPADIAEMVARPDFPECARGRLIDIRGFMGEVVDIVHNSIKVRSPEGITQSFNFHRLRTLYAPVVHLEPQPTRQAADVRRPGEAPEPAKLAEPKPEVIEEPDFSVPVKPVAEFAGRRDFPKCAFGAHVDIVGFKGVVVEIGKLSLKVRTPEGVSRSYNIALLQKIHGKG